LIPFEHLFFADGEALHPFDDFVELPKPYEDRGGTGDGSVPGMALQVTSGSTERVYVMVEWGDWRENPIEVEHVERTTRELPLRRECREEYEERKFVEDGIVGSAGDDDTRSEQRNDRGAEFGRHCWAVIEPLWDRG
jgi:hypothetical protein